MLFCNNLHEDSCGLQQDVCHAYTESFTKPWKLTFSKFPETTMLSADHMMLAAAAMLHAKFGATWPIHACVILTPNPLTNFNPSFAEDLNLPPPEIGIAFIGAPDHWMMVYQNANICMGLDGYSCEKNVKKYAPTACELLRSRGLPYRKLDYPQLWSQKCNFGCGHHCLHFLRACLFDDILEHDFYKVYKPPVPGLWTYLVSEICSLLPAIGVENSQVPCLHS